MWSAGAGGDYVDCGFEFVYAVNLYGAFVKKKMLPHEESAMAKVVSLLVKFGALIFVSRLPAPYAIEMQLLRGFGLGRCFRRWFAGCLRAG